MTTTRFSSLVHLAPALLALVVGSTGCSVANDESVDASEVELSSPSASPGSATLTLRNGPRDAPAADYVFAFAITESSTDEFLRGGETVELRLDGLHLPVNYICRSNVASVCTDEVKTFSADVEVSFRRGGQVIGGAVVPTQPWTNAPRYFEMTTTTTPFVIPRDADELAFKVIGHAPAPFGPLTFESQGGAFNTIARMPVVGAYLPNKLALFDTFGGAKRERTLEGGNPIAGAQLLLAYTDYRADTLLDASSLDATIGEVQDVIDRGGHLGSPRPVAGRVEREVWVGAYDDVTGWTTNEIKLDAVTKPALFVDPTATSGRYAFETHLGVNSNATKLRYYFHVKAFVVADYNGGFPHFSSRRYAQGERVLLRERYDNPNGPGSNYELSVDAAP